MTLRARTVAAVLGVLLGPASAFAAREAPAWLAAAAHDTACATAGAAPAVDLLRESEVIVSADGAVRRVVRLARLVRGPDGTSSAADAVVYVQGSAKVTGARAWIVHPDGSGLEIPRQRVVDRALDAQQLYDEARLQVLDLGDEVRAGDVAGWEWTVETRTVFLQDTWSPQEELPVRLARHRLRLPAGWSVECTTVRHAPIAPVVAEGAWTWEARDLADLRSEVGSPPLHALVPRVEMNWVPPASAPAPATRFASWRDVGAWLSAISDPRTDSDAALLARAEDLRRGTTGEEARLRAIGRFVQDQPYAAIEMGLERGGGYQPRPATQVLRQGYGDCKDKANLVRALLRASGMTAWLVSVRAGDPEQVDEAWPSPHPFDHCIVAVRAPWALGRPAALADPLLGPLLLFDPTDPDTPAGELPARLAGGLALVEAGDSSRLVRMPEAAAPVFERDVHATLAEDGGVSVVLEERSRGADAAEERSRHRRLAPEAYRRSLESWIGTSVNAATLQDVRVRDERDSSAFELRVAFRAPRYAAPVGEGLATLRPFLVARREHVWVSAGERRLPVRLGRSAWRESTTVMLPPGTSVDELPEPVTLDTPFGHYAARVRVEGGRLLGERELRFTPGDVPPERYPVLRDFLLRVRKADQAPVVLRLGAR